LIVAILQGFLREFVVPLVALAPSPALPLLLQQPVASSMHPPSALFLTTDACVFPPVDDAFHQPAESDEDDDESESLTRTTIVQNSEWIWDFRRRIAEYDNRIVKYLVVYETFSSMC
jgi:hypothetical protein